MSKPPEKEKSGGFFSKLFGRSKPTPTPIPQTQTLATPTQTPAQHTQQQSNPQHHVEDRAILNRARSQAGIGPTTAVPSVAASVPAKEFRFPSSLSGDKLEGVWRGFVTRTKQTNEEWKTLLDTLQLVQIDWSQEEELKHPTAVAPLSYSALPAVHPLHSHHGHPSSMIRRLVQDFTDHTENILPDELATFIAMHTGEAEDVAQEAQASGVTVQHQLERAPMYLLLAAIEHVTLYTNNRNVLQHSDFFSHLVKLTQTLCNEYLTLPSPPPPSNSSTEMPHQPFFSTSILLHYFHSMLQRCFSLIHLWIDGSETWRRSELYTLGTVDEGAERSAALPRPPIAAPHISFPISPLDQSTLTDSSIQLFVHLHPHLIQRLGRDQNFLHPSTLDPQPVSSIPPFFPLGLYRELLHLFGALCHRQPTQQEIFLQHSLHRRLLELVGSKVDLPEENVAELQKQESKQPGSADPESSVSSSSVTQTPSPASLPPLIPPSFTTRMSLRTVWFHLHVTALEVLREMCFAQTPLCIEFVKNNGVEKMLDALLWTFRIEHAPPVAAQEDIRAVTNFLSEHSLERSREDELQETFLKQQSTEGNGGAWMKSFHASFVLDPLQNPRVGTVVARDRTVVPSALLTSRGVERVHRMFNILLSMCCMDLRQEPTFHPFTAASTSPTPAGQTPLAPTPIGRRTPGGVNKLSGSPTSSPEPSHHHQSSQSGGVGVFNISFIMLQMVLDVFNTEIHSNPANDQTRALMSVVVDETSASTNLCLPFMQLQAMEFFRQLLLYKPSLLTFVRTYNVYHTLFSPAFFFLGQFVDLVPALTTGENAVPSSAPEGSPVEQSTPRAISDADAHAQLVSRLMRTSVLQLMSFFATLPTQVEPPSLGQQGARASTLAPSTAALSSPGPSAEMSYLLSLLFQRYTSPTLVAQVCGALRIVWQHRRRECCEALTSLCWQAHLGLGGSLSAQDPFKVFSKLLSFFHRANHPQPQPTTAAGGNTSASSTIPPAQREFLALIETILGSSLDMQVLALREHAFVWACFAMVESANSRRRRIGIRLTMSLVCAVGGSGEVLASLAIPPAYLLAQGGFIPTDLPQLPPTPAGVASSSSRGRAPSTEQEDAYPDGTVLTRTLSGGNGASGPGALYDHEEVQKVARVLLTKYIELFPTHCTPSLSILLDLTHGLHGLLTRHTRLHQDLCRRRHIFVQLMHILSHLGNASLIVEEEHHANEQATNGQSGLQSSSSTAQRGDQDPNAFPVSASFVREHGPPSSNVVGESSDGHLVLATEDDQPVSSVRTRSTPSAIVHNGSSAAPGEGGSESTPPPPGLLMRSISDSVVPSSTATPPRLSSPMTLLLSLLRCLTLLLSNNLRSKEVFRKNIGNELLAKLIHKVLQRELGHQTGGIDHANTVPEFARHPSLSSSNGPEIPTLAGLACRAIYGEVLRSLVEREWPELVSFEAASLSGTEFLHSTLEGALITPTGTTRRMLSERVLLLNASTTQAVLDAILPCLVALQQQFLVASTDEKVLRRGFLIKEYTAKQLRKFIQEDGGEILTIFIPRSDSDAQFEANSPTSPSPQHDDLPIQGLTGQILGGYLMLAPLSEFETQVVEVGGAGSATSSSNAASNGTANYSFDVLPKQQGEWSDFLHSHREGKRFVRQVAVLPKNPNAKGAGSLLLRAAKLRYPRGLVTSVVFGPPPFHNHPALTFFGRQSFRPIGWEMVRFPPQSMQAHFRAGYKAQVLLWNGVQGSSDGGMGRARGPRPPPLQIIAATLVEPDLVDPSGSPTGAGGPTMTYPAAQPNVTSTASSAAIMQPAVPYAGDTSFVWIQNPDVIPLVFSPHLFLLAPLHVQRDVLSVFTRLVVTSFLNQSHCCKVLLIDLLLDLFPHLPPLTQHSDELVSLQRSFLYLIQIVGTHSISVKQLKRFFSLMRSTAIKVPQEWLRSNVNQASMFAAGGTNGVDVPMTPHTKLNAVNEYMHSRESSAAVALVAPRTPSQNVNSPVANSNGGNDDLVEVQVRPWYGPLLLGAIEAMTSKCGPDHFWFLDGLTSGLTIPPLDKWPNKQGWAFSAWIRIESYVQPTISAAVGSDASLCEFPDSVAAKDTEAASIKAPAYQPRLFHFSSAPNGPFIEAYFNSARHLTLACCTVAGTPAQHQAIDYDLEPQTWYHVCISQNVAATFGTSELNVYIDAACVHSSSTLRYPNLTKQLSFCFVGTNQASSPLGGLSSASPLPSSTSAGPIQAVYGQLGPFYFFDDVLTPLQVQLMYALGPSYMFTFGPETINVNAQSRTIGSQGLDTMLPNNHAQLPSAAGQARRGSLPGTGATSVAVQQAQAQTTATHSVTLTASIASHARNLSGKIFLAYNAKARDGHLFLDNTPRSKRLNSNSTVTSRKRGMHAVALVGTHQCSTRHVAHVLTCLGGVSVLFPLLAQLDQPIHRQHSRSSASASAANMVRSSSAARGLDERILEDTEAGGNGSNGLDEGNADESVTPPATSTPNSPDGVNVKRMNSRSGVSNAPSTPSSNSIQPVSGSELVYEVDRRFLVNFLHVMYVMLGKEVNQAYMLSIHGFSVIAAQLELASPKHFTIKTVQALHKLIHGVRNNEQLFKHAFISFFLNVKLWIYVKPVIQKYWLCIVQEFVTNYPFLLNQSLNLPVMNSTSPLLGKGTQHLMDRLRGTCWFQLLQPQQTTQSTDSSDGASMATSAMNQQQQQTRMYLLHPVTQQIIGMRPSAANLQLIRSELLSTLYKTLSIPPIGVSFPDIRALVLFLQACGGGGTLVGSGGTGGALGDEGQIEDVLWLFIQLLENQSIVVLKYLSELDDLAWFVAMQQQGASSLVASSSTVGGGNTSNSTNNPSSLNSQTLLANTTATLVDSILTTSPVTAVPTQPMRGKYHYDSLKRAGMDIFLDLLYSTSSIRVRALSLRGLAKLLRSGSIVSASVQSEMFLVVEYALCGGLDGGRVCRPNVPAFTNTGSGDVSAGVAASNLVLSRKREWDESIYLALLSLMLGVHIDAENIREIRTTLLLEGTTILHTPALAILFKLCAFDSSACLSGPPLLEIILQDMMFLLNHTTINMKLMLEQQAWQEWFAEIMLMKLKDAHAIAAAAAETARSSPVSDTRTGPGQQLASAFDSVAGTSCSDETLSISAAAAALTSASHARQLSLRASSGGLLEATGTSQMNSPTSIAKTSHLAGVQADSSALFPEDKDDKETSPGSKLPPLTIPPLSPSPSEHLQSSINAQSYATSLFEQLLIHSLKKPNGYRHFDRMVVYLCFHTHHAASTGVGGGINPSTLVPRTDIPVLAFLVPLLQDLNQLLRREAETIPQLELGLLVDNVIHVLERTQDVLLERVGLHARASQSSGGGNTDATPMDSSSPSPSAFLRPISELARKEFECVWTLVEIMMVMNAWIVLFKGAYIVYREKEREKESQRRGYLGMLGSAAVGVVKGAAGAVTQATTATYRAIHDAFDLIGEPNVPATPVVPLGPIDTEGVGNENETLFFAQIMLRLCTCFELEKDASKDIVTTASTPTGPPSLSPSHASLTQLLFGSDGGQQVTQILSFLMSSDRPYGLRLSSAFRKTVVAGLSGSSTSSSTTNTPVSFNPSPASTPGPWGASPMPSPTKGGGGMGMGMGSQAPFSSNPSSPAPINPAAATQDADALTYLYTILCTLLDATADAEGQGIEGGEAVVVKREHVNAAGGSASSSGRPSPTTSPAPILTGSQVVCSFLIQLVSSIRKLHSTSTKLLTRSGSDGSASGGLASVGLPLPRSGSNSNASEPQLGWPVGSTAGMTPLPPSGLAAKPAAILGLPATGGGLSVNLAAFVPVNPNPSAAYLPPLPNEPMVSGASGPTTPTVGGSLAASTLQILLYSPAWISFLQSLRPVVHPLIGLETFAASTRISTLHKLSSKIREQHLRLLGEQMASLQDALAMVSALSSKHAMQESQRYAAMLKKRARMARRRHSTWKWMLRSLTNERGPWSQNPTPTAGASESLLLRAQQIPKKIYWKLDEVESSARMRLKLKVNYRGHSHKEAAHDYVAPAVKMGSPKALLMPGSGGGSSGTGNSATSQSSPSDPSLSSLTASGEEDQFAAAILFSKSAQGVLSPEWQDRRVTVTEPEEDWEQLEVSTKGGKASDKGLKSAPPPSETILFDTDCSLIHPTDVVGGRLRASATHLHFEARDDISFDMPTAKEKERTLERKRKLAARSKRGLTVFFEAMQDFEWNLSHVVALHFRRHQLRRCGMELFFQDHTCVFFVFANETARNAIHTKLLRALRPYARIQQARLNAAVGTNAGGVVSLLAHMSFVYAGSSGNYGVGGPWGGNAFDVIRKSGLVTAWRQRKISNFVYLMHLNTIAGRTYNDLTQYPVFPWILADYTSSSINLDDPTNSSGVFRDLTKPVGALDPERLKMFLDRYRSLDDPAMPAFMYGTHYSSAGSVLHYLMRVEPFTSAAVELQDGKFDHSDRLFHSIPATWNGVTSNAADVKELIPEFFYLPEMLVNSSGIDFGTKQHGEKIGDVILPPWANGDPHEFVRIHRAALESEYVSLNLHHWIDLIFGFKQQGRAAVEANNVFFHLTYEGGVDIDRIEDPTIREATVAQISHFGQTPSQLFTTPHPMRITKVELSESEIPSLFQQMRDWQKMQSALTLTTGGIASASSAGGESSVDASRLLLQLYTVEQVTAFAATENPLLFLALLPGSDRLLSIGLDRVMSLHKFKNTIQEYIPPFVLEVDKRKASVSSSSSATWSGAGNIGLGGASVSGGSMLSSTHASSVSNSGGGLAGALSFMGSSKANAGSGKRVGVHFTVGLNILPFFFVRSHDERFLLSAGHWDNSLRITHIDSGIGIQAISGHKDIVTCLAISEVGDYIVTGSKDTTTIVWQVAEYVIDLANHPMFVAMGPSGASAASAAASAAAAGDLYLLDTPLHVLYGHDDEVTCVSVSSDLDTVVSGSRDGTIMLHALRSGRYTRTITPPELGAIRWVGISSQGTIMSYSLFDLMLHAYTINGDVIGSCETGERLYALQFSQDGEFLLCGGDRKQLSLYQLHHNGQPLQCVHRLAPTDATIRSIVLTSEEQHILVGTGTGKLYVYGLNADFLRKRFLKRLVNVGL